MRTSRRGARMASFYAAQERKEREMAMTARGWEKIVKVDTETWTDENGVEEFGIVWLITETGDVYQRNILAGETVEAVADFYKNRGWTDLNVCYFGR